MTGEVHLSPPLFNTSLLVESFASAIFALVGFSFDSWRRDVASSRQRNNVKPASRGVVHAARGRTLGGAQISRSRAGVDARPSPARGRQGRIRAGGSSRYSPTSISHYYLREKLVPTKAKSHHYWRHHRCAGRCGYRGGRRCVSDTEKPVGSRTFPHGQFSRVLEGFHEVAANKIPK